MPLSVNASDPIFLSAGLSYLHLMRTYFRVFEFLDRDFLPSSFPRAILSIPILEFCPSHTFRFEFIFNLTALATRTISANDILNPVELFESSDNFRSTAQKRLLSWNRYGNAPNRLITDFEILSYPSRITSNQRSSNIFFVKNIFAVVPSIFLSSKTVEWPTQFLELRVS